MSIREKLNRKILICDGAMGTMIQASGLNPGKVPEILNFTAAEAIEAIHQAYFDAGSDLVCTNSFGANRLKTEGCGYTVQELVAQACLLAKNAAQRAAERTGEEKYVALDVAPTGKLLEPVGELPFEEAVELFKEQMTAGAAAGADLIFLETFTDIYEMKAAVIAAKECCDLPVFCSVTFQEDGRMLMGADPLTMVNILQDLGIDALGVNCSLGPAQMIPIVEEILRYSKLPVLVQPNAGLPRVENGETVYDVSIEEYTDAMITMLDAGVSIVGGCCGTNPQYIQSLKDRISQIGDKKADGRFPALSRANLAGLEDNPLSRFPAASSSTGTVILDDRVHVIGERINPTGKKALKEALRSGDFEYVENEAIKQVACGAEILDVNMGLPEIDELSAMREAVRRISSVVSVPLQIDSADPQVIEAAVRIYNGRPIINSVNGKQEVMDAIFPIVKKYGANVIALTLDENGLPKNAEERVAIAERIIQTAESFGISRERIIVDCLTLTVSAQQNAGLDTLSAITEVKRRFGVRTTLGASNVSFGLPERKLVNRTFLAMALFAGMDAPITDPTVTEYMDAIRSFEVLAGKDQESRDYIAYCAVRPKTENQTAAPASNPAGGEKQSAAPAANPTNRSARAGEELSLREIILGGYDKRARQAAEKLLQTMEPLAIVENIIMPALTEVGDGYETGRRFLPELIKSADTVQEAFVVLRQAMKTSGQEICYGKVILATVAGDIHDIGKNIVKVILENYGYEVIDLGRDVPVEAVVSAAKEGEIQLVGLSALMTTTVVNMEATIKALAEAGLACKTAVGGAVLTETYAKQIGADFYCRDAMDTVRAANAVFGR